ncbi:MAG: hypothetical protein A2Z18_08070 [Armatimonadetes bacterium RBG_16_58_9]|nr:MAG: hypothetical protein A2Z18_08070 [Armatimonadetes bacterium RBG_16_58_9]
MFRDFREIKPVRMHRTEIPKHRRASACGLGTAFSSRDVLRYSFREVIWGGKLNVVMEMQS